MDPELSGVPPSCRSARSSSARVASDCFQIVCLEPTIQYGKQNAQRAHCSSTVVLFLPCLYQVAVCPSMSASLSTSTKLAVTHPYTGFHIPCIDREAICVATSASMVALVVPLHKCNPENFSKIPENIISRSMFHLHADVTAISALDGIFMHSACFQRLSSCFQEHFFVCS